MIVLIIILITGIVFNNHRIVIVVGTGGMAITIRQKGPWDKSVSSFPTDRQEVRKAPKALRKLEFKRATVSISLTEARGRIVPNIFP